jgi:hypothetical protein
MVKSGMKVEIVVGGYPSEVWRGAGDKEGSRQRQGRQVVVDKTSRDIVGAGQLLTGFHSSCEVAALL